MSATPLTKLIGLDWGTSSLRAYRFDSDGQVAESRHLPAGILRVATEGFERTFENACGDWVRAGPRVSVLACGMVGSAQGWREAPYLEIPRSLDDLGGALTEVATASGAVLHIIPGAIERGPLPNVMRGEETQVAGALERGGPADALICLPGTHSKWVHVQAGRIVHFDTFMTGEVFAALCAHTLLGRTMRPPATPDLQAFDRGVEVARSPEARAGVLSTIFSARTLGLVGALAAEAQSDYLSGLLVGHEIAALLPLAEGQEGPGRGPEAIVLAGNDELCQRYRRALEAFGRTPAAIVADATERGLWRVAVSAGLVSRTDAA